VCWFFCAQRILSNQCHTCNVSILSDIMIHFTNISQQSLKTFTQTEILIRDQVIITISTISTIRKIDHRIN